MEAQRITVGYFMENNPAAVRILNLWAGYSLPLKIIFLDGSEYLQLHLCNEKQDVYNYDHINNVEEYLGTLRTLRMEWLV